jgi:hypothetical protein
MLRSYQEQGQPIGLASPAKIRKTNSREGKRMNSKVLSHDNSNFWPLTKIASLIACVGILLGSTPASGSVYNFNVPGTSPWFNTGIDIGSGSILDIIASGIVFSGIETNHYHNARGVGPLFPSQVKYSDTVIPNTVAFSLIGKIGGTTAVGTGTPVPEGVAGSGAGFVGPAYSQVIETGGRLFLGFNDNPNSFADNSGSFTVTVSITPVPEPSIFVLGGLGACALAFCRRKGNRNAVR